MSVELSKRQNIDTAIDLETPPYCASWLLIDHKSHVIRNFSPGNEHLKYEPILTNLYLKLPLVKESESQTDNDIAF